METIEFIDTHTHIFEKKIDFTSIDLSNILAMVVPSYSMKNLNETLEFCNSHNKCFCALGVHPAYVENFDVKILKKMISTNRNKIFAVGEIGLDNFAKVDYEKQKDALIQQLQLAREFDLPISVHLRNYEDFTNFFNTMESFKDLRVALHCFNGDSADLERALQNDWYISFATNITYKGNVRLRELSKSVPMEKLLIETDSPNMLPAQFQRKGVNISQNIIYVAEVLSKIRNCTIQDIAEQTTKNAKNLFKI